MKQKFNFVCLIVFVSIVTIDYVIYSYIYIYINERYLNDQIRDKNWFSEV